MHILRLEKCTSLVLSAMLLCYGSATMAAESDQKAKPAETAVSATLQHVEAVQNLPEIVAKVNGTDIKAIELRRAEKVMMSGKSGMQIPPDKQKEFDQQALAQLVSAELLYQAGQKVDAKDIDKQIDEKIAQSKARFTKPEDFVKAIKELEMDEADLRDYTRRDLIITNFIEKTIVPKITVTEEESRKFYDQNPDKFNRSETVRASHILIGVDAKASAEDKKKAREKAEKLRKDLAGGADFAALAKGNSTCPSSQQGGDLGFFGKGQMVPAFEQAAFALKPGEVSDVVETQFGYHIIKLMEKKAAETVAFKDVRPRIEEFLKGQKISAAVNSYLTEAKKSAKVDILLK